MNERRYFSVAASPIGDLLLVANERALTALFMTWTEGTLESIGASRDDNRLRPVRAQLDEYFAARRTAFDLPLEPAGTAFQRQVWSALREIPYGTTISYRELASRIGHPNAIRAVGAANGRNPIAIIIPCHRVIGADGSLTGFGGGLHRKRALLDLEARTVGSLLGF